jgi:hypothetical protein
MSFRLKSSDGLTESGTMVAANCRPTQGVRCTPCMSMFDLTPAIFAARQLSDGRLLMHAPPHDLYLPPGGASQKS